MVESSEKKQNTDMSDVNTQNADLDSQKMSGMVNRAFRMMIGTLASRVLGLLREVITAGFFGATRSLDSFYVAYTLANLSRQLLAEGALSASFVPVFSRVLKRDGVAAALHTSRQVLTILILACSVVVVVGIIISPILVSIIAPGFEKEQKELTVTFTRALFPFLLLVSVGALAMGVLNSTGSFFVPAIAPAASNLAFIFILLLMRDHMSIWVVIVAVLVGGGCNMLLQWAWAYRSGMMLTPAKPDINNKDLRETVSLFLPYAAGLSLNQINPIISRVLGSCLEGGVISVLNYADRIIQLPLGIFVIAISQAVLPMLSRVDLNDVDGFRIFVRDALRFNLFVVLPASIGLIMLASPIVHLLLVRGAFGEWAWVATSGVLACYAAGLPGISCNTVLMRALYARSLPRTAMAVTLLTVCSNLMFGVTLMHFFSYRGLALGSSCAFTLAAFAGVWGVSRNIGCRVRLFDIKWVVKSILSCTVMACALSGVLFVFPYPTGSCFSARTLWLLVVITGAVSIYAVTTFLIGCPEWQWIRDAFSRKKKS